MYKFIVVAALVAVAAAGEMKFTDCGNHEVTKLLVDGCSGDTCTIKRGQQLHMEADFVANQDTKNMKIDIFATVSGVKIPVPGVETNGCNHAKCPVKKGEAVVFKYDLLVPSELPAVDGVVVTASLRGDNGLLACGSVKGTLQ